MGKNIETKLQYYMYCILYMHDTRLVAVVMFLSYITDSSPAPLPGPPEPVGVASAQHTGTQLIELLLTDKDFIAVSEEVRALLTPPLVGLTSAYISCTALLLLLCCYVCVHVSLDAEHHLSTSEQRKSWRDLQVLRDYQSGSSA